MCSVNFSLFISLYFLFVKLTFWPEGGAVEERQRQDDDGQKLWPRGTFDLTAVSLNRK